MKGCVRALKLFSRREIKQNALTTEVYLFCASPARYLHGSPLNRLNAYVTPNVVPESQCDFRSNRSTVDLMKKLQINPKLALHVAMSQIRGFRSKPKSIIWIEILIRNKLWVLDPNYKNNLDRKNPNSRLSGW